MKKLSEKQYTFKIIVTSDGTLKAERTESIQWDMNQGMGQGCHKASDALLAGQATRRGGYADNDNSVKPPRDLQHTRVDIQDIV